MTEAERLQRAEKKKARARAWYLKNKKITIERSRAWGAANPEKVRAKNRAYRAAHLENGRKQTRAWAAANPDKILARNRAYRAANPEKMRTQGRRSHTLTRYGVSPEQRTAMLAAQSNRCAICGTSAPCGAGTWHLDHDHSTGKRRGLLCQRCNLGLGMFLDDPLRLSAAIKYLRKHKSRATLNN